MLSLPAQARSALVLLVGGLAPGLSAGCRDSEAPAIPAARGSKTPSALDRSRLGRDRAVNLDALGMPHHRIAGQLGAHRIRIRSKLETKVPTHPQRRVEQEVRLGVNGEGHFAAVKHTDPQSGQELVWTGKWLFSRLRHSQFVRRAPKTRGEPGSVADRMYGLLPAYVDLLGRFMKVERIGEAKQDGRDGIKVRLGLRKTPEAPRPGGAPARAWRRHVAPRTIKGLAVLCARTGAPLSVELEASWSFHPPAGGENRTGIPRKVDQESVGLTSLTFKQRITDIGGNVAVEAPPPEDVQPNSRRIRLEVERQMLTGERPVAGRVDGHEDVDDGD